MQLQHQPAWSLFIRIALFSVPYSCTPLPAADNLRYGFKKLNSSRLYS